MTALLLAFFTTLILFLPMLSIWLIFSYVIYLICFKIFLLLLLLAAPFLFAYDCLNLGIPLPCLFTKTFLPIVSPNSSLVPFLLWLATMLINCKITYSIFDPYLSSCHLLFSHYVILKLSNQVSLWILLLNSRSILFSNFLACSLNENQELWSCIKLSNTLLVEIFYPNYKIMYLGSIVLTFKGY